MTAGSSDSSVYDGSQVVRAVKDIAFGSVRHLKLTPPQLINLFPIFFRLLFLQRIFATFPPTSSQHEIHDPDTLNSMFIRLPDLGSHLPTTASPLGWCPKFLNTHST